MSKKKTALSVFVFFFQLTTCRVQEITIDILKLVSEEAFKWKCQHCMQGFKN